MKLTVRFLDTKKNYNIYIYNIIAVTIGFNRTIYTVQEEIGFVTWIVVASGPVDSDIVIRINEITSGRSATSMS